MNSKEKCASLEESSFVCSEKLDRSLETLKSAIADVLQKPISECSFVKAPFGVFESIKGFRNINHVKELNDKLAQLESENFKLKLKLYYHEEEKTRPGHSSDSNQHIQLKVELQEQKRELRKRNELLKEALVCLNRIDKVSIKEPQTSSTSSDLGLTSNHEKEFSEPESSLTSQECNTTITDNSVADTPFAIDQQSLMKRFNQCMDDALTLNPKFDAIITHLKDCFNVGLEKVSEDSETNQPFLQDLLTRMQWLEVELNRCKEELETAKKPKFPSHGHEIELELRSLHQAVLEKDRQIKEAIEDKCCILKEAEDRYKSVMNIIRERNEEIQQLKFQKEITEDNRKITHVDKSQQIDLSCPRASDDTVSMDETKLDRLLNERNDVLTKSSEETHAWKDKHAVLLLETNQKDDIIKNLKMELKGFLDGSKKENFSNQAHFTSPSGQQNLIESSGPSVRMNNASNEEKTVHEKSLTKSLRTGIVAVNEMEKDVCHEENANLGKSNDVNHLRDEIQHLILRNQQLQCQINNEQNDDENYALQSTAWDASSIHVPITSLMEFSKSMVEPGLSVSVSEILRNFKGTDTVYYLLSHIRELEKFLQKLLSCDELLSEDFLTHSSIQHLKKAILEIDRSLDANQSSLCLSYMDRTYKSLPPSMINLEVTGAEKVLDANEESDESDGTSRDRNISVISSKSHTKSINEKKKTDAVHQNSEESMKDSCLLKGTKNQTIHSCQHHFVELVRRVEIALETLFKELAGYHNEIPQMILQVMDSLKNVNERFQHNLLEGQMLNTFEIIGDKMNSLEKALKDFDGAARTLSAKLNFIKDCQEGTIPKEKFVDVSPTNSNAVVNQSPTEESKVLSTHQKQFNDDPELRNYKNFILKSFCKEGSCESNLSETVSTPIIVIESIEILVDSYNQLVESLRSSVDWLKSVNDMELNNLLKTQEIENMLKDLEAVSTETLSKTSCNFTEGLRTISRKLPDWVQNNRTLFQFLTSNLKDKNQRLQAAEEQAVIRNKNLELKFKDLKQVQDWNLRLQNELDREKISLQTALQRLASTEEAFEAASGEVKTKSEMVSKLWEENTFLKVSLEHTVSDSVACKELCNKLESEVNFLKSLRENIDLEKRKIKNDLAACQSRIANDSHLKCEYEMEINVLKEQLQKLSVSEEGLLQEKVATVSELISLREKLLRYKDSEASWESLEEKFKDKIDHLESLLASQEANIIAKSGREREHQGANLEEDCKLLGEKLNEIRKKDRELVAKLKSSKELVKKICSERDDLQLKRDVAERNYLEEKSIKAELLKQLQLETEEKTALENQLSDFFVRTEPFDQNPIKMKKHGTAVISENPVNISVQESKIEKLEMEVAALKLTGINDQISLRKALVHEKEKADRYKKKFAYAKMLLINKKPLTKPYNIEDETKLAESDGELVQCEKDTVKSSLKLLKINQNPSNESEKKAIEILAKNFTAEEHQSLEKVIIDLLSEMNLLKADLENTVKNNENLSVELRKYQCQSAPSLNNLKSIAATTAEGGDSATSNVALMNWSCLTNENAILSKVKGNPLLISTENDLLSSSDSLLHSRVIGHIEGSYNSKFFRAINCNEVPVRDIDNDTMYNPTTTVDFLSSNEEIQTILASAKSRKPRTPRTAYSSPDLGIESDPNRDRRSSGSSLAAASSINNKNQLIHASVSKLNGMEDSTLSVKGRLGNLYLLSKEIEESTAILEGINARVKDRILAHSQTSNFTSPAKGLEYSTLKEVDLGCYKIKVCLDKSNALISSFWIEPKPTENASTRTDEDKDELKRLRLLADEQSKKLKDALAVVAGFQSRKETVDKAISKQLSKTKKVLKKAKGNLLEENKRPQNLLVGAAFKNKTNEAQHSLFTKPVASTPLVKQSK